MYQYLNNMPNFSIKFSFVYDDSHVVHHKTSIVRASSVDAAKSKLCSRMLALSGKPYSDFKIEKISVSSYNYVFV